MPEETTPAVPRKPGRPKAQRDPAIAAEVRSHRLRVGLTQAEFARKFGVTLNAVQKWEAGDTIPSPGTLPRMRRMKTRQDGESQGRP